MSHITICNDLLLCMLSTKFYFFFNDTATTEIYTLSLHDALPILSEVLTKYGIDSNGTDTIPLFSLQTHEIQGTNEHLERSEEHTSELQSRSDLVCRLLLEKKNKNSSVLALIYDVHSTNSSSNMSY